MSLFHALAKNGFPCFRKYNFLNKVSRLPDLRVEFNGALFMFTLFVIMLNVYSVVSREKR